MSVVLTNIIGGYLILGFIKYVSSSPIIYRKIIRGDYYCIDYSDDDGETWDLDLVNIYVEEDIIIIDIDDNPEGYRELVRDGAYVIDYELTPTGFAGTEDIDWVNVYYLHG